MIAERIQDPEVVKSVLLRPDIMATIAEDDPGELEPDMERNIWLGMLVPELIGVYQIERINGITAQLHANVLPEFRKEYSKASGWAALEWVVENLPAIHKLVAVIPVIYPNVRDFTCSFGFKQEGVNRESYLKHGQIHDQWILGITRPEIGVLRWAA